MHLEDAKTLWEFHAVGQEPRSADVDGRDVQRLLEYPAAGYQVAVEIPSQVLEAYRRLRAAGFDGHCLRGG